MTRTQIATVTAMALAFIAGATPVGIYLSRPAGLYGLTQYDDGVYFSAAVHFLSGVIPYRDFVFVQPPGIVEILAPFAALGHIVGGRSALGAARIMTAVVEGADCSLIVFLLRKRGLLAASFGGLLFAAFPPAYSADHTFLLEPFLDLFCLIGLALVFSEERFASTRRVLLGGAALAFAGLIKVFAIVPFAVILLVLLARDIRKARAFVLGALIVGVVLALPFIVLAPHGFYHDVIASQLQRVTRRPTPFVNRVYAIVGLSYSSSSAALTLPRAALATWVMGAVILGLSVWGGIVLLRRRRGSLFDIAVLICAFASTGMMFVPSAFYDHYALFSAMFIVLLLGDSFGLLIEWVRGRLTSGHLGRAQLQHRVLGSGAMVLLVIGAFLIESSSVRYVVAARVNKFGDPGPAIAKTVPDRGCIITDASSILVSGARLGTPNQNCPAIVDATGTWISIDPVHLPNNRGVGPRDPSLVSLWKGAFSRADYVVLSGVCAFRIPWTSELYTYFDTHFRRLSGPYGLAFVRGTPKTVSQSPQLATLCHDARVRRATRS